ncbi:MAG: outer membrane protein transport protein [Flavobacteriales bacterium]|nr:outer membrane protein transport protein [Flavobacteriales bacterium]
MKRIVIAILFACPLLVFGQSEQDVYRYSHTQFGGTARYNSVAGAFGAVGADFSVLSTNPAGMGRFRESDFSFTPTLNLSSTTSIHNGSSATASKENFNLNNLGVVFVSKAHPESPSLWRAVQFGFGYNKLANFHEHTLISSLDTTSFSMVLADQAYGATTEELDNYQVSPFMASPAWWAWLIDPLNGQGGKDVYTTQMYVDSIQQDHEYINKGSLGEWSFALSGNYNDKLYIGGSVNFQRFSFEQEKIQSETSLIDTTSLISFSYTENLKTIGKGVNLKLGMIYLPTQWLRLGISYHSPTVYYTMRDSWYTNVSTFWRTTDTYRTDTYYSVDSPDGRFTYKMRTPGRITGSVAFVVKRKGLISADVEFVDYTTGLLKSHPGSGDSYSFELENTAVKDNFNQAINIRLGGEYRITNLWMVRAGAAYYQNGYNPSVVTSTNPMMTYAGGIGYRAKDFYVDVAYTYTKQVSDYYKYDPLITSAAQLTKVSSNIMATVGFKF